MLERPSMNNWLGTDLYGADVLNSCLLGTLSEAAARVCLGAVLHVGGVAFGVLAGSLRPGAAKSAASGWVSLWAALPHFLFAVVLLIVLGAGWWQLWLAILSPLLASHLLLGLDAASQFLRHPSAQAAQALGFSGSSFRRFQLLPAVHRTLLPSTMARLPEILWLHLSLSFFGFGVRPPQPSLGRLMFDGLPFLEAAWWTWLPPALLVCGLGVAVSRLSLLERFGKIVASLAQQRIQP